MASSKCFARSHFKCQPSIVSDRPCLELVSDTQSCITLHMWLLAGLRSGLLGVYKSGSMNFEVSHCSNSIVWRAWCAGAHCLAGRCQRHDDNGTCKWQHLLHHYQYNVMILCNSKKSFICYTLSSSFGVDLTTLLTEGIGQNGPKTTN